MPGFLVSFFDKSSFVSILGQWFSFPPCLSHFPRIAVMFLIQVFCDVYIFCSSFPQSFNKSVSDFSDQCSNFFNLIWLIFCINGVLIVSVVYIRGNRGAVSALNYQKEGFRSSTTRSEFLTGRLLERGHA